MRKGVMKMKKTKIISLLSALLAAIMLFASCSNPGDNGGKSDAQYRADVATWFEYLEYDESYEENRFYKAPTEFFELDSSNAKLLGFSDDGLVAFKKYSFSKSDATPIYQFPEADYKGDLLGYIIPATVTWTVYDLVTETAVWTATATETAEFSVYNYNYDYISLEKAESFEADTSYTVSFVENTGFFKVKKAHTYTPKATEQEPNPTETTDYTYTVYDVKGTVLLSDEADIVFEASRHFPINGYEYPYTLYETVIGDVKYIIRDCEIIYETESYDNRVLPVVNASTDGCHYSWFFDESITNDFVVQIFDADYKFVCEKRFENVTDARAEQLANGNLLVFYYTELSEAAEEYDAITPDGNKAVYSYSILSNTGAVTDLEIPVFLCDGQNSFVTPAASGENSFKVKTGYNLLLGYAIDEDKTVSESDVVYYVYDNSMALVKELPKIVLGQYGLPYFTASGMIAFRAYVAGIGDTSYLVTKDSFDYDYQYEKYVTSRPTLYADLDCKIANGFLIDGVLYNDSLNRQQSLNLDGWTIENPNYYGAVIVKKTGDTYSPSDSYHLYYINEDGYSSSKSIPSYYWNEDSFVKYYQNGTTYICDKHFNTLVYYSSGSATTEDFSRSGVSGAYIEVSGTYSFYK